MFKLSSGYNVHANASMIAIEFIFYSAIPLPIFTVY
jgi:hypothetical protein